MPLKNPQIWPVMPGYDADVMDEVKIEYTDLTNAVTYQKLFPLITQQPISAGGLPPQRIGFNSLFKMLFEQVFFMMHGGFYQWDETVSYDAGAIVFRKNALYLSKVDNNQGHKPEEDEDEVYWDDNITQSASILIAAVLPDDAQAKQNVFYAIPHSASTGQAFTGDMTTVQIDTDGLKPDELEKLEAGVGVIAPV